MTVKATLWRYGSADLASLRTGALGGALAGVAAGAVSRLSMRGVAVLAGLEPDFSLGGTLVILIIGAILGMPFAWLYRGVGRFLPVPERWRGGA